MYGLHSRSGHDFRPKGDAWKKERSWRNEQLTGRQGARCLHRSWGGRKSFVPVRCQSDCLAAHVPNDGSTLSGKSRFPRQKETAPPAKAGSAVEASYPYWQHEDWRTEMAALLSGPEFPPLSAAFLRHQLLSRCRLAGRCHRHFPALHPAPPHAF